MRRYVVMGALALVVAVGVYLAVFKRGQVARLAKGYKAADTPQAAADMFKKAVQAREYEYAADYCTRDYAEQLRRGAAAAKEYGDALDNLTYQMKERDLIRDEVKVVLYRLDPFPKDVAIVVGKEAGDTAEAVLTFATPTFKGGGPTSTEWKLKDDILQVFVRSMRFGNTATAAVGMKKEAGAWKFDFPADPALQTRVGHLNDKYKNYVNPFQIVTQEVKNDPSTKENATQRLRTLLEQAALE